MPSLQILSSALEVNELLLMDHVNKFLYDRLKSDINRAAKLNNFERTLLSKLKGIIKFLYPIMPNLLIYSRTLKRLITFV